jgi:hypothetical protein
MDFDDVEISLARDAVNVKGIDWVFEREELDYDELDDLGPVDAAEDARIQNLVKGLLWNASISIVDHMFDDLATVTADEDSDDAYRPQIVLGMLPERFMDHYDAHFCRMFLVAIVDVTARIAGTWSPLPTVAHELALRALLEEAMSIKETSEIDLPDDWRSDLEESLFEDLDHEFLYDNRRIEETAVAQHAGITPMGIHDWFTPFSDESRPAPYATTVEEHFA